METADRALVQRFVRDGDGEAFATLMNQYADMVFGTCRRVLGNDDQAADATQETFFQFLKDAGRVQGSLGGWLHQVATRRAVDLVRQETARRRREQAYATDVLPQAETWEEIAPLVDESLEALPEPLRDVLILHFLERRTTVQMARALGVSQPTISRRIATALEQLRQNLRARDVTVGLAGLQGMLAHGAPAAPLPLLHSLGKMALAHAAASGTAKTASVIGPLLATGLKIALTAAVLTGVVGSGWVVLNRGMGARARNSGGGATTRQTPTAALVNTASTQPAAAEEPPASAPVANPGTVTADVAPPPALTNEFPISLDPSGPGGGASLGGPSGWRGPVPQAGGIGGGGGGFMVGGGGFGSVPPGFNPAAFPAGRLGFGSGPMNLGPGGRFGVPPGPGTGFSGGVWVAGTAFGGRPGFSAAATNFSYGSSMSWSGSVSVTAGPAGSPLIRTNFSFGGSASSGADGGTIPGRWAPRP